MTLQPVVNIGMQTHDDGNQYFRVESGEGEAIIDGAHHSLADGDVSPPPEHVAFRRLTSRPHGAGIGAIPPRVYLGRHGVG